MKASLLKPQINKPSCCCTRSCPGRTPEENNAKAYCSNYPQPPTTEYSPNRRQEDLSPIVVPAWMVIILCMGSFILGVAIITAGLR